MKRHFLQVQNLAKRFTGKIPSESLTVFENADKILLMSNGPGAVIAESVWVDLPRPRQRADIIHHPGYYKIRNYLVDFLVKRSKTISAQPGVQHFPKHVNPTQDVHEAHEPVETVSIHAVNH